ncbi:MAG TPA: zinc ribbon domain-containing protein [Pirellulales bacterium]|nr:zinc ribbon domain-containing protein [Pirellulales bacterium]
MPLYEYQCDACGDEFELLVRSGDKPECPSCRSPRLAKRLSVPAAPVTSGTNLPMADAPFMGCGKPGCGPGGCGMGN